MHLRSCNSKMFECVSEAAHMYSVKTQAEYKSQDTRQDTSSKLTITHTVTQRFEMRIRHGQNHRRSTPPAKKTFSSDPSLKTIRVIIPSSHIPKENWGLTSDILMT